MIHGTYSKKGPIEHLRDEGALLLQDHGKPENWLAQFDSHRLTESLGWSSLPKADFTLIVRDFDKKNRVRS